MGSEGLKKLFKKSFDISETCTPVRWCAMGDSISFGAISLLKNGKWITSWDYKTEGWTYKLAEMKGWKLTNRAISGTGYMQHHTNNGIAVKDAAWNVAEKIASETKDGVKGFNRFDIVTLMYGVNDWAYNAQKLGNLNDSVKNPVTFVGGMRKTIETILKSNPLCKIYVITPLNRMGTVAKNISLTEENNWALGYKKTNMGTLEDVFCAIQSVCEYYGIEMIDMTHSSIVNRKSLPYCLPDNTHPTKETHTILARELCEKIKFR